MHENRDRVGAGKKEETQRGERRKNNMSVLKKFNINKILLANIAIQVRISP